MSSLPISEIFYSLSGEGLSAGLPCVFVRVAGCNLPEKEHNACRYCDTPFAQFVWQGTETPIADIVKQVAQYPTKNVILTGGEPLWHDELRMTKLVASLLKRDYHLEIETNGSLPVWSKFPGTWSLDIKTPCSGNTQFNLYGNLSKLRNRDQVKFIIGSREDFDFAKAVINTHHTRATVIFQPAWKDLNPAILAEWIKKEVPFGRLGLQQQKIIYGDKRGI